WREFHAPHLTSPRGGRDEWRSRRPHLTSPRGGEGPFAKSTPPPGLPMRWGGTWGNQALQFHSPVRCSALALPESALVSIASTVPVCPDRSSVKTTLSDAEVFCHTCASSVECSCTATARVS